MVTAIPSDGNPDKACAFSVGDKLYGLSFDMVRSMARVLTYIIAKMPCGINYEETCTLPMVFLTVMYALKKEAQLNSSDPVLIYFADGCVGVVALQYSQSIGVKVFSTASPSKHE